jgi:hypothetical protein
VLPQTRGLIKTRMKKIVKQKYLMKNGEELSSDETAKVVKELLAGGQAANFLFKTYDIKKVSIFGVLPTVHFLKAAPSLATTGEYSGTRSQKMSWAISCFQRSRTMQRETSIPKDSQRCL